MYNFDHVAKLNREMNKDGYSLHLNRLVSPDVIVKTFCGDEYTLCNVSDIEKYKTASEVILAIREKECVI